MERFRARNDQAAAIWQLGVASLFCAACKLGHDLSEFYEGGLEKGGFSKLNLRKVRRRPGGGGGGGRTLKA